ncbi:P-loop containing nucleoside triphosphate hydrolase protein [Mycena pura]|uniref:P-loop containing nucleoside triphosphate hydrolase protein n=1 Tax=Mycena pura TaxID=153505 RepID=A0AAD6YJE4_9AGAR|nr:P-loop containing nucleoside triphosphate hydrolase protein [Mycena pura]
MLPSVPKIFHGRESELSNILQLFTQDAPRIAVLGAGGMGKTSLARAVLHHPDINVKYGEYRIFVTCDGVSTAAELVALIANYQGLELGENPTQQIIRHFASRPPTLLILDNLETAWEPMGSRIEIEKFLSLLTDIQQLALIITMRGAERPAQVCWTRPFFQPLQPLTHDAAQKTFLDIAGELHDSIDVEKILHLTYNMPLAVDLVAHLVDSEGCATVLSRWDTERTSVVSDGYDQRSNLDMSISLSLSSPRVASVSGTKDLLILLSMLPDGLSDIDFKDSKFPIDNILECKATLLRTSLAYSSSQKRLRVLVPIREHMQRYHTARLDIVEPLFHKCRELLELYQKHKGTMLSEIVPQIKLNFSNIQSLLSFRILQVQLDHSQTIYCAIDFRHFSFDTGAEIMTTFMDLIPSILPKPIDHRLEVYFISECFAVKGIKSSILLGAEVLVEQALEHFPHFNDIDIKCKCFDQYHRLRLK